MSWLRERTQLVTDNYEVFDPKGRPLLLLVRINRPAGRSPNCITQTWKLNFSADSAP